MSLPQPVGARVLIRPWTPPETSEAGIVLTMVEKGPDVMGTVLKVGTLDMHEGVEEGMTVLFPPTVGQYIEIAGERMLVVPADEILAIVEEA